MRTVFCYFTQIFTIKFVSLSRVPRHAIRADSFCWKQPFMPEHSRAISYSVKKSSTSTRNSCRQIDFAKHYVARPINAVFDKAYYSSTSTRNPGRQIDFATHYVARPLNAVFDKAYCSSTSTRNPCRQLLLKKAFYARAQPSNFL